MLLSVSSNRIEAFVQLITLVIIFALVLAMTYLWAITKKRRWLEPIFQF